MFLIFLTAAAAAPHPGELRTFGDWTVGCDNGRACQAVALLPENDGEGFSTMVVERGAAADAPVTISLNLGETRPAYAEAVGRRIRLEPARDAVAQIAPADVPALIAASRAAPVLVLRDAGGKPVGSVSMKGAVAALLYMDDRQQRIGTVTALIRPGPKPAGAVPSPPALPVIVQPPSSPRPPRTIPAGKATALIGPDNARCDYTDAKVQPEAHRLDAEHSVVLVNHPCGNGAYNYFSSAYVVDESGRIAPAHFDADPGMNEGQPGRTDWSGDLVNADWNGKLRGIDTLAKGRGLSDCGVAQSFVWDGERFRLIEQSVMGECRGSTDYITTWRAEVR